MMSMGAENGWRRSKYPLQASQPPIEQPPSPEVTSDEKHQWSFTQLQQDSSLVARSETRSQTSEDCHTTSSHGYDDESRTAVSRSLASQSPRSCPVDHRSQTGEADYHNLTTLPSDDPQPSSPTIQLDRIGPGRRTLRRTSRSQRISSRVSLVDTVEPRTSSPPGSTISTISSQGSTTRVHRKRQQYPLQDISNGSVSYQPVILSSEEKAALSSVPPTEVFGMNRQPSRDRSPKQRPAPSANIMAHTLPASPPTSESDTETSPTPQPQPSEKNKAQSTESKPSRRRRYPLQAPASMADLGRPLTPPSPERQVNSERKPEAHEAETREPEARHPTQSTGKRQLPRRKYPLQDQASIMNIKEESLLDIPKEAHEMQEVAAEDRQFKPSPATTQKHLRRQRYPMQYPVFTANLPQQQEERLENLEKTTSRESEEALDEVPAELKPVPKKKAFRRRAYPLQSPASIADLQHVATSAPSRKAETGPSPSKQLPSIEESPSRSKTLKRQKYPLQSPASTADLQRASLPPPSVSDEVEYVSEKPQPPMTPEMPSTDGDNAEAPEILLPKNIRAVKDKARPKDKSRTIVVCLDGTGDKFDDDNSNIVQFVSALKKDDSKQVTYYQAGIGTYSKGGLSSGFEAAMDMAVGSGLGLHVRDAYHFLMHSYKEGDRICIFGFSRGAYTARCLAGMVHKVGLLPARNIQQIEFAYEFYKNDTAIGWKQSEEFKRTFSIDVNVYFLGCFDSVASVGFIPRQLPLSSTPSSKARYFRHAMALDERRAKFKICRFQTAKSVEEVETAASSPTETDGTKLLHVLPNYKSQQDQPPAYSPTKQYGKHNHPNVTDEEYERFYRKEDFETDTLEVWFAGCHADIGGGAVANVERHKLAQIPLRWMIRQAFECNTGIIFKTKVLAEYGLDVHTLWPQYRALAVPSHEPPSDFLVKYEKCLPPRSLRRSKLVPVDKDDHKEDFYRLLSHTDEDWTPEQVEDFYDAMCPLNDQLVQAPSWWILEIWPVQYKISRTPGEVLNVVGMNLGRYRLVEDYEANLHWTVLHRAKHLGYKVHARPAAHTQWRTVA